MRAYPKTESRESVLPEAMANAGSAYFWFLHDRKEFSRLAARGYCIKRMYDTRFRDYKPYYSIEEFAYDLNEAGIEPAPTKEAVKAQRVRRAAVKRAGHKRNRKFIYEGQARTLNELAEISGISSKVLNMRIKRGWTLERAMKTPVMSASEGGSIGADRRWMKEKS